MKVKLLYDRVLIRPDSLEKVTDGGIIIPDTASREKVAMGTVIEIGSGVPYGIKESELSGEFKEIKRKIRVVYGRFAGSELEINDEKLLVLNFKDIIGIIN